MKKGVTIAVILLNLAIVASEIIFGIVANSMGLIADALHNFSDVVALVITYLAIVYAEKAATKRMTYGYVRSEAMAGFVNSLLLILAMVYIGYESVMKLLNPQPVDGWYMLIVAAIAAVGNGISVFLLKDNPAHSHGHSHEHHHDEEHEHKHEEDLNIRSAILHLTGDVAISLAVVLGGLAIIFFKLNFIDPVLSLGFTVWILIKSISLFRSSFYKMMDRNEEDVDRIVALICGTEGVLSVHEVHWSQPSSKDSYFSAHLVLKENLELCQVEGLIETIRERLAKEGITHLVLQPETIKYDSDNILCQSH